MRGWQLGWALKDEEEPPMRSGQGAFWADKQTCTKLLWWHRGELVAQRSGEESRVSPYRSSERFGPWEAEGAM